MPIEPKVPHTLLLADDSVTIQRVIELTFADEDVQVVAVGDGEQAIKILDARPPDIVLADIGMPKVDGYEVAQHIKSTPSLAHIPVVLLTGAFEPVDEVRAARVGADAVLSKPFEPQLVITRVRELLARRAGRAACRRACRRRPRSFPPPPPKSEMPARRGARLHRPGSHRRADPGSRGSRTRRRAVPGGQPPGGDARRNRRACRGAARGDRRGVLRPAGPGLCVARRRHGPIRGTCGRTLTA